MKLLQNPKEANAVRGNAKAGGKFLLLPPGYQGDFPKTGYHVLQGTMNNYNVMVRDIVQNGDKDAAANPPDPRKLLPLNNQPVKSQLQAGRC